jgi:hypothetical protein
MSIRKVLVAIVLTVSLLGLWPGTAEAYLDPGTGSHVFQMLVAAADDHLLLSSPLFEDEATRPRPGSGRVVSRWRGNE